VSWVSEGGVVACVPAACVSDEYNSPSTLLDPVIGISGRTPFRNLSTYTNLESTLTITDSRFGSGQIDLFAPVVDLSTTTTTPVATLSPNNKPGITINNYGSGYGIAYAFFPGYQYKRSANWDNSVGEPSQFSILPCGWGEIQRKIISTPVITIAKTEKQVNLSHETVEACTLKSTEGVAIILLNWSGKSIDHLTITVKTQFSNIKSAQHSPVSSNRINESLRITVPLEYVDIISID